MKAKRKRSLPGPLLFAGAAALGYVGARALLGLTPGADEDFFDWKGPTEKGVDIGSAVVDLPIMYYRDDSFMGMFPAAYEPVRTLLPSRDLYPVTLPDGRATVGIFAFNYLETGIGPYGEIGVAIPCTHGHQAPALVPLLLESRYPGWGGFVLHLPVTSLVARDGEPQPHARALVLIARGIEPGGARAGLRALAAAQCRPDCAASRAMMRWRWSARGDNASTSRPHTCTRPA